MKIKYPGSSVGTLVCGLSVLFASAGSGVWAADQLPVADNDFSCISKEEANRYVRDFNIDVSSFGGLELCQSRVDTKKLFNDLRLVEQGRFRTTGKNLLIADFVEASRYYTWLKSETNGMSRGNDVPYATAYNSGGYFTMQDGWAKSSTLGRVGTVIHEARHTEGYGHIGCRQGPYQGASVSGCDPTYAYGGSHAVEMEYYARVVTQGENFHPVYRTMARLMAMARTNFVFNTSPIRVRETLALREKGTGQVWLADGNQLLARETPAASGAVLKRTSFGMALFEHRQTLAIDPYGNTGLNPVTAIEDTYSYFKLLLQDMGRGPERLLDFEEFDIGTKRYVVALKENNSVGSYYFAGGKWNRFKPVGAARAQRFVTALPDGTSGLFLVSDKNEIVPFDPERQQVGTVLPQVWPQGLRATAKVNGKLFLLSAQGEVLQQYGTGSMAPWEPGQSREFTEIVSAPLYDAFEVSH